MSEQSVDPRIVRTKKMLKEALAELIEEKGFDAITVKDLTTRAGLNRGTFYLNYVDKYDLLEKSEEEALQGLSEITRHANPSEVRQYLARKEVYPPLIRVFEYLIEHKTFFKAILGPKGNPTFQKKLRDFMETKFYEKLIPLHTNDAAKVVPIDYLIAYFTSANLGVIQHWFESGMKYTPREMATMMASLSLNGPTGLLFSASAPPAKEPPDQP
ncbi:TetR/AcrR family transcriptional regulator [Brevibacillus nitrificans]|uniref:TetR/AcrR family transcriptional regulator n=1 Tax=Brevibacillus nitrificans TaxID=651560 RepID=UPI002860881B|nr:TetR/AcrR family transcriptional regulator [Brevibacillus nitrificans]MDR7319414.1 AcrR family transcriptional regulator [Brevibacillus nitrificans]